MWSSCADPAVPLVLYRCPPDTPLAGRPELAVRCLLHHQVTPLAAHSHRIQLRLTAQLLQLPLAHGSPRTHQ